MDECETLKSMSMENNSECESECIGINNRRDRKNE